MCPGCCEPFDVQCVDFDALSHLIDAKLGFNTFSLGFNTFSLLERNERSLQKIGKSQGDFSYLMNLLRQALFALKRKLGVGATKKNILQLPWMVQTETTSFIYVGLYLMCFSL